MREVIVALLIGGAVGTVFALFRSVPPAPPTWAGVAGIVGIVAGWQAAAWALDNVAALSNLTSLLSRFGRG